MKDLLLGIIIGILATSLSFMLIFQQNQISTLQEKQKSIIKDVDSLALKIGPLHVDKKGKK
jgi:hypothetical protein